MKREHEFYSSFCLLFGRATETVESLRSAVDDIASVEGRGWKLIRAVCDDFRSSVWKCNDLERISGSRDKVR